jgi:flagellar FliJ protein
MKAFQYSMQGLLDAKVAIEDARRGRVAAAIRDLEQEKKRLIELIAESERAAHGGTHAQHVSTHDMELRSRYVSHLRLQATKCAHAVIACEHTLSQRRTELARATMERETIEKLREREESAWRQEAKRKEQKELDEAALQQHARNRRTHAVSGQHLAA